MDYLLIIGALLSLGAKNILSALYQRTAVRFSPALFSLINSVAVLLLFFVYNGCMFRYNKTVFILACLFGICFCLTMVFGIMALKYGSIALTSLISSYSLVLPTLFGIFFYKDNLSAYFFVGALLLLLSLFFINKVYNAPEQAKVTRLKAHSAAEPQGTDPCQRPKNTFVNRYFCFYNKKTPADTVGAGIPRCRTRINGLWILCVTIAFFTNGLCSIIQSYTQKLVNGDFKAEFMIVAMIIVILANAAILLMRRDRTILLGIKKASFLGFWAGICTGLLNLFVMLLTAGTLPLSIIFPTISAGTVILVYVASRFIFREKLSKSQNIGFILGIISIALLNL